MRIIYHILMEWIACGYEMDSLQIRLHRRRKCMDRTGEEQGDVIAVAAECSQ